MLKLNRNGITSRGVVELSKLDWKQLETIHMRDNKIDDEGGKMIVEGEWPSLKTIQLGTVCSYGRPQWFFGGDQETPEGEILQQARDDFFLMPPSKFIITYLPTLALLIIAISMHNTVVHNSNIE